MCPLSNFSDTIHRLAGPPQAVSTCVLYSCDPIVVCRQAVLCDVLDLTVIHILMWAQTFIGESPVLPDIYWRVSCVTWHLLARLLCYLTFIGVSPMLPDIYWRVSCVTWHLLASPLCYLTFIGASPMLPDIYWRVSNVTWHLSARLLCYLTFIGASHMLPDIYWRVSCVTWHLLAHLLYMCYLTFTGESPIIYGIDLYTIHVCGEIKNLNCSNFKGGN